MYVAVDLDTLVEHELGRLSRGVRAERLGARRLACSNTRMLDFRAFLICDCRVHTCSSIVKTAAVCCEDLP